jgi:hypothetical protein
MEQIYRKYTRQWNRYTENTQDNGTDIQKIHKTMEQIYRKYTRQWEGIKGQYNLPMPLLSWG